MSKAKMQAAKELIGEKNYDQARKILATVDHPTAREWEAKIDRLQPPPNGNAPKKTKAKRLLLNVAVLILLAIVLFIAFQQYQQYTGIIAGGQQSASDVLTTQAAPP